MNMKLVAMVAASLLPAFSVAGPTGSGPSR
jgi:hypothetical protein